MGSFLKVTMALLTLLALQGCGSSSANLGVLTSTPLAQDDVYHTIGNVTLRIEPEEGLLTNDLAEEAVITDFRGGESPRLVNGQDVLDDIGPSGGSLTLNQDGSFTYTPTDGFQGVETFSYTITNSSGSSTAQVSFNIDSLTYFVDNTADSAKTGSQRFPFSSLQDAVDKATEGDIIFILQGDGTSRNLTGPVTLPDGVSLLGAGKGLNFSRTLIPPDFAPEVEGPITCRGNNLVAGLTFTGTSPALECPDNTPNLDIRDNEFRNSPGPTGAQIQLGTVAGLVVENNRFTLSANSSGLSFSMTDFTVSYQILSNRFELLNSTSQADNGISVVAFQPFGVSVTGLLLEVDANRFQGSLSGMFDTAIQISGVGTPATLALVRNNYSSDITNNFVSLSTEDGVYGGLSAEGNLSERNGGAAYDIFARNASRGVSMFFSGNTVTYSTEAINITLAGAFSLLQMKNNILAGGVAINAIPDNPTTQREIVGNVFGNSADIGDGSSIQVPEMGNTLLEGADIEIEGPLDDGTLKLFSNVAIDALEENTPLIAPGVGGPILPISNPPPRPTE